MDKELACYLGLFTYLIFIGAMAYYVTPWALVIILLTGFKCDNKSRLEN